MKPDEGLTLIELLVTLVIVAILSVLITRALSSFILVKARTDEAMGSFDRMARVFLIMRHDVEQALPLSMGSIPLFDDQFVATFPDGKPNVPWLSFIRMSPDRLGRGFPPERISYKFVGGRLVRSHGRIYHGSAVQTAVILDNVVSIEAKYFSSKDHRWCDRWPCVGAKGLETPEAVSLIVAVVDGSNVHQVFLLPK
ncbi:type II secretion system protein GspJ [Candidatus Ichthyocystis hellenicum]|uniref:type II secretion system protein GspJ n=1 Tax=Candidatus Ichthyocystis hellenicum TaxID=1561003 RepID=UPI000B88AA39|nr:type II secretion system protein GspJ [Candidatus Ichthyocystis hellenicum]